MKVQTPIEGSNIANLRQAVVKKAESQPFIPNIWSLSFEQPERLPYGRLDPSDAEKPLCVCLQRLLNLLGRCLQGTGDLACSSRMKWLGLGTGEVAYVLNDLNAPLPYAEVLRRAPSTEKEGT